MLPTIVVYNFLLYFQYKHVFSSIAVAVDTIVSQAKIDQLMYIYVVYYRQSTMLLSKKRNYCISITYCNRTFSPQKSSLTTSLISVDDDGIRALQ